MGLLHSIIDQNFPPKALWTVDDIPDLTGKVILVTGGNTGLGKETIRALLKRNAKVYMGARDSSKAETAIKELAEDTGKEAVFLMLDLADLHSVKQAAEELKSKETMLHVLFNNAGVMVPPVTEISKDGYDLQWGTNVLGHFFLTNLLLPLLETAALSAPGPKARVINTSSQVHVLAPGIEWDTLKDGPARLQKSPNWLYNQSKFGNVVFSNELARRYGERGIVSIALHPGLLKTELGRHRSNFTRSIIHTLCHDPPSGAITQLRGGTDPVLASENGKYMIPWGRFGEPHPDTNNPELGKKLWDWLEAQVEGF